MPSIKLEEKDTVVAAPYIVPTTGRWDFNDGYWCTFEVSVGTPPQSFRVLPATIDPRMSIITDDGCKGGMSGVTDCGDRRGVNNYNGASSRGFQWSATQSPTSSTYRYIGPYGEYTGQNNFLATGPLGNDTLTLTSKDTSTNITMTSQIIAGVSDANFWFGTFGLGNALTNYTQNAFTAPSLLYNMRNQSIIPSTSYGYTAGRYYDNKADGSLILGGYDANKMTPSNSVTTKINRDAKQRLYISITQITAISGGDSQPVLINADGNPTSALIDSSLTHMYLPEDACKNLESRFGLTYNETTNYYLINNTMHDLLRGNNASLAFGLSGDSGAMTINMPYKSLDLQAGIPWYQPNQNIFPIRKAANSSQVVLGRVFLQEAYIAVDWERQNFTLSAVNKAASAARVVAITTPEATSSVPAVTASASSSATPEQSSSGGGIGAGAIAGIVVGVLVIAALGALFFCFRRRGKRSAPEGNRRRSVPSWMSWRKSMQAPPAYDEHLAPEHYGKEDNPEGDMTETKTPHSHISELYDSSKRPAELHSEQVRRAAELEQERELMSTPVAELGSGEAIGSELVGSDVDVTSNPGRASIASGSSTRRTSLASPGISTMSPERARSPLSQEASHEHGTLHELE